MRWWYDPKAEGFFEGTKIPFVRHYLVNEEGVRVRPVPARESWMCHYEDGDFKFGFMASSTTVGDLENYDKPAPLGPKCHVSFLGATHRVAKLNNTSKAVIAKNVVEALRAHCKIPFAVPPHVDEVVFSPSTKIALGFQD